MLQHLLPVVEAVVRQPARCSRHLSSVCDQMLMFVRTAQKDQQSLIDIIRAGLYTFPPDTIEGKRLLLEMARVQLVNMNREAALEACQSVLASEHKSSPEEHTALALAGHLSTTSLLLLGRDVEAHQTVDKMSQAMQAQEDVVSSLTVAGLRLLLCHAQTTPSAEASRSPEDCNPGTMMAQEIQNTLKCKTVEGTGSMFCAAAQKVLGDYEAAQGRLQEAAASYDAATELARAARQVALGDPTAFIPISLIQQVAADVAVGKAQASIAAEKWDDAEEQLGSSLTIFEESSTGNEPHVAITLSLLGYVYSRTARVTYAEGLYREAAKMLSLDPSTTQRAYVHQHPLVHPSVLAMLCWRFHQLLTVLPKRSNEAHLWQEMSEGIWKKAGPIGKASLADVYGSADLLGGKGRHGSGVVVNTIVSRVLAAGL